MLHWVRCLDSSFFPVAHPASAGSSAQSSDLTPPPASARMARLMQVRQRARRGKQIAALLLPLLLGLGGWSASSTAQAGDVVWSVGVGVPGAATGLGLEG
jgi:hypothetical protein